MPRYDFFPHQTSSHNNSDMCGKWKVAGSCWDNDTSDEQIQCFYGLVSENGLDKMPGYFIQESLGEKGAVLHVDQAPRHICNVSEEIADQELPG
jgi:hypothetical protein